LAERLADQGALWTLFGAGDTLDARAEHWLSLARAKAGRTGAAPHMHRDLAPLVDEMRLVKDSHEIEAMRRAAAISAAAHVRAMRSCRPGVREYELEAELLHEFRRAGAVGPAYESIVAAGANACVLHHPAGDSELRAGEVCLIDAGCEYAGYASDVTRTIPVDGRFTAPQRDIYELVLASQEAAIKAVKPGAEFIDYFNAELVPGLEMSGGFGRFQPGGPAPAVVVRELHRLGQRSPRHQVTARLEVAGQVRHHHGLVARSHVVQHVTGHHHQVERRRQLHRGQVGQHPADVLGAGPGPGQHVGGLFAGGIQLGLSRDGLTGVAAQQHKDRHHSHSQQHGHDKGAEDGWKNPSLCVGLPWLSGQKFEPP